MALHRLLLLTLLALALLLVSSDPTRAEAACDTTVAPGDDVLGAIGRTRGTVCLLTGTYPTFALNGSGNSVTIRGAGPGSTVIDATGGNDLIIMATADVTLTGLTVRGNLYVSRSRGFTLSSAQIEQSSIGVHIDRDTTAKLFDVTVTGSLDVGLLVRTGSSVEGNNIHILDTGNAGVAAVANAASLTLRDSEVARVGSGPGIFAGISGCAELGAGTLEVPSCFLANLNGFVSRTNVTLERVSLHDGPGTGLVLFPGVRAEVHQTEVAGWGLTGMFAWGASAHVASSTFRDNVEHGIELRSYPHPQADNIVARAVGLVEDTTVRNGRPLPDGYLGGGLIAQNADMSLARDSVTDNAGIGVLYENGSSGFVSGSTIANNGHTGLCINRGNRVSVTDTRIYGNAGNDPHGCGG